MKHLIYLDNAATTFPKPPEVLNATLNAMRSFGGNAGRGSHSLARKAAEILYNCREEIADFVGLSDPTRVIFTNNTTHALNIAIRGFLKQGDHVLISDMEHNAVYRPIEALKREGRITYSTFSTESLRMRGIAPTLFPLMQQNTRAIICTHASNVCSLALPIAEIGRFCHREGLLFLVDGAQSVGRLPIDIEEMHITALASPGHKGLYGPQGSGFLVLSDALTEEEFPPPLLIGGSGYASLLPEMPPLPPERYEAGTIPVQNVAGLLEGVRFVKRVGIPTIQAHEDALFCDMRDALQEIPGVTLYAEHEIGSVLSFSVDGIPAEAIAESLDRSGICVRAGFHCAALAHKTLGTPAESGTVRLGFGYFNTPKEIRKTVEVISQVARER